MVFSIHDFTDSEPESEEAQPLHPVSEPVESASGIYSREPSEASVPQDSPFRAGPSTETHPLRVTLRPSLNHLVNDGAHLDPAQQHSDRSSLSPPPPITLRLGMKQAIAERAAYSSSSDEDGPPSMKARTSPSKRFHPPAFEDPSMPAQHRTSYDWLQPSFAAASHHGPPERIMPEIMSWSPSDEGEGKDGKGKDGKGKKSHKRRPDNAPPGPGKAWRKGLKKWVLPRAMIADGRGMPIPWREGGAFLGDLCPAYPIGTLPGQATPRSQEGTPEPGNEHDSGPHAGSPSFVLADPTRLGFLVFSKPIATPKLNLGPFPKVTQFFAPNNGGDTGPFPRKERVRSWKRSERTAVGIGGGRLKFKTWTKGPSSELGRLVQADKDAKEITRPKPKPAPADVPLLTFTAAPWDRPPLPQTHSFDSASPDQVVEEPEEGAGSEVGDGEEIVAGSVREGAPVPSKGRGTKGGKAKRRKSKLAQEILPVSGGSSTAEPVM